MRRDIRTQQRCSAEKDKMFGGKDKHSADSGETFIW